MTRRPTNTEPNHDKGSAHVTEHSRDDMSRSEALTFLGLDPDADDHQIDYRFWQLTKRYRAQRDDRALERLSSAYKIASGRSDAAKAEEQKNLLVPRYFGKTKEAWINHFRYDWWKYVFAIIIAVILFFLVSRIAFDKTYEIIPTKPSERVELMPEAGYGWYPPDGYLVISDTVDDT